MVWGPALWGWGFPGRTHLMQFSGESRIMQAVAITAPCATHYIESTGGSPTLQTFGPRGISSEQDRRPPSRGWGKDEIEF